MANDRVCAADFEQHAGGNLARISAFFFPVQVLRSDGHVRSLYGVDRSTKVNVWRADNDFIAIMIRDHGKKVAQEVASLVWRLVHFPVGSDEFLSHEDPFSVWYEIVRF
jgi:hypothetical protein